MLVMKCCQRQFSLPRTDLALPMSDFLAVAIRRLERTHVFIRIGYPAYVMLIILGMNLVIPGLLRQRPFETRLLYHCVISAILICMAVFGMKSWMRRFKQLELPLLQELKGTASKEI
jgi:hypothetical protein